MKLSQLMINQQQLNLVQLEGWSLKQICVSWLGLDESPAPPSHDDQLKALQPLSVARKQQTLN